MFSIKQVTPLVSFSSSGFRVPVAEREHTFCSERQCHYLSESLMAGPTYKSAPSAGWLHLLHLVEEDVARWQTKRGHCQKMGSLQWVISIATRCHVCLTFKAPFDQCMGAGLINWHSSCSLTTIFTAALETPGAICFRK